MLISSHENIRMKSAEVSMNSLLILLLLSMPTPNVSFAVMCPSQPKTAAALIDLERAWANALSVRNATTVSCFLADEFQDAGVEGELSDRAAALKKIPSRRPGENRLEDMHAHIY